MSVFYAYGFTKSQFVIVTLSAGAPAATTFSSLIALTNVSVARIEGAPPAGPVAVVSTTPTTPPGASPDASCPFVKGSGPSIFQLASGQKRLLPDWDTYLARGGDPDLKNVCMRTDAQLDAIPTGDPVPKGR